MNIRNPISDNTNPVGVGRVSCMWFPVYHAKERTPIETASTVYADFLGSAHRSTQGMSPLRLNVILYQATYRNTRETEPSNPRVKDSDFQGPGVESFRVMTLSMMTEPTMAWAFQLGKPASSMTNRRGFCA